MATESCGRSRVFAKLISALTYPDAPSSRPRPMTITNMRPDCGERVSPLRTAGAALAGGAPGVSAWR